MSNHTETNSIEHTEHEIGVELGSLSHGSGNYSCSRGGKGQLEQEHREHLAHGLFRGVHKEAAHPHKRVGPGVAAEAEAKAKGPVADASEDHIQGIFHHDVDLILGVDAA